MARKKQKAGGDGTAATSSSPRRATATAKVNIPLSYFEPGFSGPHRVERGTKFEAEAATIKKLKSIGYAE